MKLKGPLSAGERALSVHSKGFRSPLPSLMVSTGTVADSRNFLKLWGASPPLPSSSPLPPRSSSIPLPKRQLLLNGINLPGLQEKLLRLLMVLALLLLLLFRSISTVF